jgi:hypothetical protein
MARAGRQRSYAWALHLNASNVDATSIGERAREGLDYAIELAEDALERSRDPRRQQQLEPLTIEQLADEDDLDPAEITHAIALARRRLFGSLSDAAIYKRLQRQRGRTTRQCGEPECTTVIPITAPANKRYCSNHSTGKARTARHRRPNPSSPPKPKHPRMGSQSL